MSWIRALDDTFDRRLDVFYSVAEESDASTGMRSTLLPHTTRRCPRTL